MHSCTQRNLHNSIFWLKRSETSYKIFSRSHQNHTHFGIKTQIKRVQLPQYIQHATRNYQLLTVILSTSSIIVPTNPSYRRRKEIFLKTNISFNKHDGKFEEKCFWHNLVGIACSSGSNHTFVFQGKNNCPFHLEKRSNLDSVEQVWMMQ